VSLSWLHVAWLGALAACAQPVSAALELTVRDDAGRPVQGARVEVDGVRVALSDAAGLARASVHAQRAGRMRVAVRCPDVFRSPPERSLPLAADAPRLRLELVCRPLLRTLVVAVRAPGAPSAWVRGDGQPLGQLAADGSFHGVLQRPPGSELRLTIDTSDRPELRPQHPVRELEVADRDEIVVLDARFEPAPRAAARHRVRRAPDSTRPYAIKAER
jgi:hypothetical protein